MSSTKWFMVMLLAIMFWFDVFIVVLLFTGDTVGVVAGVVMASIAIPLTAGIVKEFISDWSKV